jgi:hypothetical protein
VRIVVKNNDGITMRVYLSERRMARNLQVILQISYMNHCYL